MLYTLLILRLRPAPTAWHGTSRSFWPRGVGPPGDRRPSGGPGVIRRTGGGEQHLKRFLNSARSMACGCRASPTGWRAVCASVDVDRLCARCNRRSTSGTARPKRRLLQATRRRGGPIHRRAERVGFDVPPWLGLEDEVQQVRSPSSEEDDPGHARPRRREAHTAPWKSRWTSGTSKARVASRIVRFSAMPGKHHAHRSDQLAYFYRIRRGSSLWFAAHRYFPQCTEKQSGLGRFPSAPFLHF